MSDMEIRHTLGFEQRPYRYCPHCTYRSPLEGQEYHGPRCPNREHRRDVELGTQGGHHDRP